MNLRDMKNWWNIAARENAKTAIMSGQSNWDDADFFASGDDWLRGDFEFFSKCVGSRGLVQLSGKYALDFGCGIGRMTRALSRHYERVIGIDISDEMIGRAISANDNQNIEYRVVDRLPLDLNAGPFELVFSTIVIQHISPPHNKDYAKGLMQLVTPGGLILF